MVKKVLIDTNFLVECLKNKIDLFSEIDRLIFSYELFILDRTFKELEYIKIEYKALLKRFLEKFSVIKTSEFPEDYTVDDILTKLSSEYIICTQDRELKRRLNGQKIIIRQKKYLGLKD